MRNVLTNRQSVRVGTYINTYHHLTKQQLSIQLLDSFLKYMCRAICDLYEPTALHVQLLDSFLKCMCRAIRDLFTYHEATALSLELSRGFPGTAV